MPVMVWDFCIYAGEDLPEDTQSDMPEEEKIDPNKKIEAHLAFLKRTD